MSEVKIYTEPVPGVKNSHNRREILQKIEKQITTIDFSRNELGKGKINLDNIIRILDYLEEDTRLLDIGQTKRVVQRLCNTCDIPLEQQQDSWNCFNRNNLWKIWKTIQEEKQ